MGRYRRKPYKKRQIDPWHEWDLEEEIQEEIDIFSSENDFPELYEEDETLPDYFDEPDIVKQLREEERIGKLPIIPPEDEHTEKEEQLIDYDLPEFKEYIPPSTSSDEKPSTEKITSYNDAYKLAKKALENL
ncbi:MAG: hypothetical protein R6U21_00690 [Thermoplasmatota archaeon]